MSAPLNIGALLLAELLLHESRFAGRTGPDDKVAAIVTRRCLLGWLRAAGLYGASEQDVDASIQSFASLGWIKLGTPYMDIRHPLAGRPILLTLAGRQAAASRGVQEQAESVRTVAAYCAGPLQPRARAASFPAARRPPLSPQPASADTPSPAPGGAGAF